MTGNGCGGGATPIDEIMILKTEQARLVCEEKQREMLFNLFSLAGISSLLSGTCYEGKGRDVYSMRAVRIYVFALKYFEHNRSICPLIGLWKGSGDEWLDIGNEEVRSVVDIIPLSWSIGSVHELFPSVVIDAIRRGTLLSDNSRHYPSIEEVLLSDSIIITGEEERNTPLLCDFHCKLDFHSSRSIRSIIVRHPTSDLRIVESSVAPVNRVMLLPREVEVYYQGSGGGDVYSKAFNITVPLTGGNEEVLGNDAVSSGRSKHWKLVVISVHSRCILETGNRSDGTCCYRWMEVSDIDQLKVEEGKTKVVLRFGVNLLESSFEIDSLQELHACYNMIHSLSTYLREDICRGSGSRDKFAPSLMELTSAIQSSVVDTSIDYFGSFESNSNVTSADSLALSLPLPAVDVNQKEVIGVIDRLNIGGTELPPAVVRFVDTNLGFLSRIMERTTAIEKKVIIDHYSLL